MPRFLVYVDADSVDAISEAFDQLDAGAIEEYFTLTNDGKPILFDDFMVSNSDWCNKLANKCANLTEKS